MKYKLLPALFLLATANTFALEGKIVDREGNPIVGATIQNAVSKKSILTNENGQFEVSNDVDELHIVAPGYSHRIVHLHDIEGETLLITLSQTVIEQVDVIGLPIHASIIESAMPVAVLSGDSLRNQQASTLGDTLERQPGVNSNFHGNVASTPIIRGLSGPRVLITQNGLDVGDQSRVGPDHAVASEVSTAQQVEILRGPSTLFYGSGAIGGVVNVVDNRVPKDSESKTEVIASHDTVNNQQLLSLNSKTGTHNWGFYADGFWREADDYKVPSSSFEDDHEGENIVANSSEESSGYTLGASYFLDEGFVGLAIERFDRSYGIPGHSHGGHEEEEGEERVYADLEQDRYQLQSELSIDSNWLRAIKIKGAYTEYEHVEIEEGVVGTVFSNETSELRLDFFHHEFKHWKGGINLHYKRSEAAAEGEEAFTPPSTSETLAIAFMEEKHIGDLLFQFGGRAEQVKLNADNVFLPSLEVHTHDEATSDDHDEHTEEATRAFAVNHTFTPISISLGAVWDYWPGYNIGMALSHSQRAPSASELLSFGPHIGTRSYEIGSLFQLHEVGDEAHFELTDTNLTLESSNNIDLTFRKFEGDVGIILNAFFNRVNDYYYQQATAYFAESSHSHEDEHDHTDDVSEEDEHSDELPLYVFTHEDSEFYGLEAQLIWKQSRHWKTSFFSDFVHSELTDGRYLPRTPPFRFGTDIDFTYSHLNANLSWSHYAKQNKVASFESTTEGYNILDLMVTYQIPINTVDLGFFIKTENLTNTEARVHTSFIKDVAPRPGRNFSFGVRGTF